MFSYVYTVNYESQYSVIVLNCFSTPAVLSVRNGVGVNARAPSR